MNGYRWYWFAVTLFATLLIWPAVHGSVIAIMWLLWIFGEFDT